jgi:pyruvate-formate lyase
MAVNLAIGGQTKEGKDAVNELTYISVEACENIRLPRPAVSFKWFAGTSHEFMDRAMQAVQKHGGGQPAFYNDLGVMRSLENIGIDKKDTWNWAPVGCIEASIPGKFDFACKGPRINIAKVLEITLNNGSDPNTGVTLLPGDGDLSSFRSMDEIRDAFEKQLHYFMEQQVILENMNDQMHIRLDINAFRSSLIDDCIERGKSLIQGGSIYSSDGGPAVGAMTAADCLTGIETAVFDQKWIKGDELKHAIETNYEDNTTTPTGEEIRLMLLNRAPKFGNDNDLADKWASAVTEYLGSHYVKDFKNSRFGKGPVPCTYAFCQSSVTANVAMGKNVRATPDGRKAGAPLNNGISPATGVEKNGITATINSVSKLPSIWFSKGAIFNMRLSPSILQSAAGRRRVTALVETLFKNYQYHVQFNVVSTETLRDAQKHPERYKDLMVRIAGYSAFFAPLSKELQEDIIKRTVFEEGNC